VEAFHAAQDSVTTAAATAGAAALTVAVTAATGGLGAAPAAALMMGTAAGGLGSMGVKHALMGDSYGREAAGVDLAMTAVNTATAGLMATGPMVNGLPQMLASNGIGTFAPGVGGSLVNTMATQVVQGGVGGIISGTASGLMDENTWRGGGNGAANVFKSIGSNMVGGIAGGVIQTGAGKIPGLDGDGIAPAFATGFLGGAGGSAAQLAIDPNTYNGRVEDVLGRFGSSAIPAGIQGGLLNAVQSVQHKNYLAKQAAELAANGNIPPPSIDAPPPSIDTPPTVEVTPPPVVDATPPVVETHPPVVEVEPQKLLPSGNEQLLLPANTETVPVVEAPVVSDGNNNNGGGGGGGGDGGGGGGDASDQGHRDALVELAKRAKTPAELQQIKEWAVELDAANPTPMREALAELHVEANADGVVTPTEGAALTTWEREQATLPASEEHFDFKKAATDNDEAGARAKEIKKLEKTDPDAAALLAPKEANPELSTDIQGLMSGADAARVSEDPKLAALQSQRAQFETAVAMSPEAQAAVKPMLDQVAAKALDYLTKMHGDGNGNIDPKVLERLGVDPTKKNYAGAVGTDPETLLKVMKEGNVRERMVALSEFQEKILGVDALAATADTDAGRQAKAKMEALFGQDAGQSGGFDGEDLGRLMKRTEEYRKNTPADKLDGKAVFNPQGEAHDGYWEAKGQNMDTKLPAFTAEAMQQQMGIDTGGKSTGIGEGNMLARSGMSIEEAQAMGLQLSDAEIAQAKRAAQNPKSGLAEGELPWVTGSKANMVDPNAEFIKDAKGNAMPLKAGISGTTARGMGLFDVMGVNQTNPELARLALMTQLQPIEAHSYHEIASAADGYMSGEKGSQFKYDVSNPYSNMG
ncbi:MAG: hypothetical protein AB7L94_25185, partial [Kofleriaceae bacterium]